MTTQSIVNRHNDFLKQRLIPKPGEPIEGNYVIDPRNKDFHKPIKHRYKKH